MGAKSPQKATILFIAIPAYLKIILLGLKYASPAEFADEFLKQISVSYWNSDTDRLALIITLSNISCVQVVLRLEIHPDVSRYAQRFLQGHSYIK